MWIITDKQLEKISQAMRLEFEKRAYYACKYLVAEQREYCSEEEIKQIIHLQTGKIMRYNIADEELSIEFIELSLKCPVLCTEIFDKKVDKLLLESTNDSEKIDIIINYFNL